MESHVWRAARTASIRGEGRTAVDRKAAVRRVTVARAVFAAIVAAALGIGGWVITMHTADYQRNQYFEARKYQVAAAAVSIDHRDVLALRGDALDVVTPEYKRLRLKLIDIKETDSRIRFAYLMRPRNGRMIFLVDAEDPASADYSPPGQVYTRAKRSEFATFRGDRDPDPEVYGPMTDRWGTWICADAYILDGSGKPVAFLGTDVDVREALASFNNIKRLGVTAAALAVVLFLLVAFQWIFWRYNKDAREALQAEIADSAMRLNEELLAADRMKSEFISVASHELRGPINAVNIAVKTSRSEAWEKLDPTERELLDVANHGVERLTELVDNLLDVTQMEAGHLDVDPEEVDLGELVTRTAIVFQPLAAERGLSLLVLVPRGDHRAVVDPRAVKRVLENLITNAIKFTDYGEISVELMDDEHNAYITVTDTGRGIPEEYREEIFRKFSRLHLTTEPSERGSGLGLAICKGLVEAHGGRIWVESVEGQGSAFHVELPRVAKNRGGKRTL